MIPETRKAPVSLLTVAALLAPLGPLATIPGLDLPLSAITLAALTLWALVSIARGTRPRMPFDLAWPVAIIVILCLLAAREETGPALGLLFAAPVFLAILHFAANRSVVLSALWWFCLAQSGLCGLELMAAFWPAWLQGCLPATLAPDAGVACFFSNTVNAAMTHAGLGLVLAIGLMLSPGLPVLRRVALLPACALMGVWLAYVLPSVAFAYGRDDLAGFTLSPASLLLAMTMLWLVARVLGRLTVGRMEDDAGCHVGLMATIIVGILLTFLTGPRVTLPTVMLFSLTAAYARPIPAGAKNALPGGLMPVIVLATVALAILHGAFYASWHVPANLAHTESRFAALVASGEHEKARRLLDFTEPHCAAAADYWRAELALDEEHPIPAAKAYVRATQPACGPSAAALFGENRMDAFLDALRDLCSAVPVQERGVAYERALLARGRRSLALASLKLFADKPSSHSVPPEPLANAVATLLGDSSLTEELLTWEDGVLLSAFQGLGARIHTGASGAAPVVLTALHDGDALTVGCFTVAGNIGAWRESKPGHATTGVPQWRNTAWEAILEHPDGGPMASADLRQAASIDFLTDTEPVPSLALTVRIP